MQKSLEGGVPTKVETFRVGDVIYNHALIIPYAENLPVQEIPLKELEQSVAEGNYYWVDDNGEKLGPHQILSDWSRAKTIAAWRGHITSIENADFSDPIWLLKGAMPFDGMHRVTRAFLENKETIKAKVFDEMPREAIIDGIDPEQDINEQLKKRE